ncbi:PIGR protein, partial [Nyctiprogne leucopyga]|nr:PIGR protein [Nyctiprogne leucopyga]
PVSSTLYGSRFLTGEVGGSVTHQCFYFITPANKHDRKYWCKISRSGVCYTIISTTGYTSRDYTGRVSLEDISQNGTFTVTLTELKSSDTGIYRCGIGNTNRALYVSLNLTVVADAGGLGPTELIRGELRGSVTVLCPPGDIQGREKRFWCKLGRTGCTLIADTNGYVGRSYQGRIFLTPQESSGAFKILINDLKKEDSGLYRCGTGRPSGRDSPRVVALQVTAASTLPKRPKFLSNTVGGSLSIKCHYDPKGTYEKKYLCQWKEARCSLLVDVDGFVHESYKGRIQITSNDQEHGTYTVVMSQLREEDAGWYWCGAKQGQTEHTSSVKLLIQKGTCAKNTNIESTSTKNTNIESTSTKSTNIESTNTKSTNTKNTNIESTNTKNTNIKSTSAESTSALLPADPPGTFVTFPSKIYHESSSGESPLLPAVLPVLILLIFITSTILILTKIKLQKETGEGRNATGNLEAAPIRADLNPVKEQPMEETPSPKCRTGSGKHRWVSSGTGTTSVISYGRREEKQILSRG